MIGVGVIGYGYWGPNLVRNFDAQETGYVAAVCDARQEKLDLVKALYPSARTYLRVEDMLDDERVTAVAVATPVDTRYPLAMQCLAAGRHTFVEKPLTSSVETAESLVAEARTRDLVLMVDHTFLYTGAVRKLRELIDEGELGSLYEYDSVRVNLGLFQHDVNVVWDLAVHDLAIMDYLLDASPVAVSSCGISNIEGQTENTAYMTMFFEEALMAHVHVSWLSPVKVRRTLVSGSRKMAIFDDLEPSEKIKVYDRGVTFGEGSDSRYKMLIDYRTGDMWAPQIAPTEALRLETAHFLDCVEHGKTPLSDGEAGLRVVRILEAASRSIEARGAPVDIA
jgi:predicted dehydrogenase